MLILQNGERFSTPCALLAGAFDGFHRGHGCLLEAARASGLPVAVLSVTGCKAGGDLFTAEERRAVFERLGIACVLEYAFTPAFRATGAAEFLQRLFARVNAKHVFCGEDVRFGAGAAGTPQTLGELAPCPVTVLPLLRADGEKVSASRIKKMIANADMGGANALLCVPYFLQGRVEAGRRVGRTLGFPTLNLTPAPEKVLPGEGVYGGYAETPAGRFPAVVNIGARPTFGVAEKKIEAYLSGFSGDLYGQTVRIFPQEFYRPVTAFPSAAALRTQLAKDKERLQCAIGKSPKDSCHTTPST